MSFSLFGYIDLLYVPCIPSLSRTFTMKRYCILSKVFSASNEIIMCLLPFSVYVNYVY